MKHNYQCSNELFRLGWLELENEKMIDACLNDLAGIAAHLKGEGAFESDTIAIFVEPLLRGLGWETLNHDEVDRAPRGNYPDFELYCTDCDGTIKRVAVIEVKSLDTGDPYLRREALEQLYGYVTKRLNFPGKPEWVVTLKDKPVLCGIVTNGKSWHIYDFHGECQEHRCDFELQDSSRKQTFIDALGRRHLPSRLGLK
jgi:hypothetical protein